MKLIIAVVITAIVTISSPPKLKLNNTVANTSKSSTVTKVTKATATSKELEIHEGTVTPIVTSTVPTCDSYDALIVENFGSENFITAKAIMKAESGCRSDAVGDLKITYIQNGVTYGMSCGLFQIRILPGRPSCDELKDPSKNIVYAGQMFKHSGFKPWSAYKNKSYRKHL